MSTTLAHNGLPSGVIRFEMLRLFEQVARPGFGLSSTSVALVRHYVLKTMNADYLSGRICAVWTQDCRFAQSLGLTPRSVNSAERELERAGFIVRIACINGERNGDRHEGVITWAAGIDRARAADIVLIEGECSPQSSLDFWKTMGFQEMRPRCGNNPWVYLTLTKSISLPAGQSVEVLIRVFGQDHLYL